MSTDNKEHVIYFESGKYTVRADETVLDALLRQGVNVPFSCKGGVCQACMMRCVEGEVPERAQRGLVPEQQRRGCLLVCVCEPQTDMSLLRGTPEDHVTECMLHEATPLAEAENTFKVKFELARACPMTVGDRLRVVSPEGSVEPLMEVTAVDSDWDVTATLRLTENAHRPDWLSGDPFGVMFFVRGPFVEGSRDGFQPEQPQPQPQPEVWQALGDGAKVRVVLEDFYDQVYEDERLAPFFQHVTKERLVEKQYSFMHQLFTGKKVYFGNRPRNIHHWMVISDDLMDHRRRILDAAMLRHGVTDEQRHVWHAYEENYRPDIVKDEAWPLKVGENEYVDLESFDKEVLLEATLCDYCGNEVLAGEEVIYHRRTGKISCPRCSS